MQKNKMRILIDGVDGCGKTTVVDMLSKRFKLPIVKMPNMKEYFEKGTAEEFSKLFNETIVQFRKYPFIMDRGFPSSIVYNDVYDRKFDLTYLDEIEKQLDCKVVILTATPTAFLKRRPFDDIITGEKRIHINEAYLALAQEKGYTVIDTSELAPVDVAEEIVMRLQLK